MEFTLKPYTKKNKYLSLILKNHIYDKNKKTIKFDTINRYC